MADPPRDDKRKPRSPAQEERYDPMPSLLGLPAHLVRQLGERGRKIVLVTLAVVAVGTIVGFAVLVPAIGEEKDEQAGRQSAAEAAAREARIRELRAEQRVLRGKGTPEDAAAPAAERLAARRVLLDDLREAIAGDARERTRSGELDGPIRDVTCEGYPRTADRRRPEEDLARTSARYQCLAATSLIEESDRNSAGAIGHPFRARMNFETGRFAWCKISGRPAEGALTEAPLVGVPEKCGGDPPESEP